MTLMVYDMKGYIGDLATNTGYHNLKEALINRGEAFKDFFTDGVIDDPEKLITALDDFDMSTLPNDVKKTALNLRTLAKKCAGVVIATDGVGIEDDNLTDEDYT